MPDQQLLDVGDRVPRYVLADLADEPVRHRLVIMLAQGAQRLGGRHDNQLLVSASERMALEQVRRLGGEARLLHLVRVGPGERTAARYGG
jgi:hypothetical protein